MVKCPNCPLPEGTACIGETPGRHGWACKFAAEGHPVQIKAVVDRSTGNVVNGSAKPAEFPSLATQVVTAATSAVKFVASGFKLVTNEELESRLAVCRGCDNFDAGANRCRLCGCYTSLKLRLATEKCPAGKW